MHPTARLGILGLAMIGMQIGAAAAQVSKQEAAEPTPRVLRRQAEREERVMLARQREAEVIGAYHRRQNLAQSSSLRAKAMRAKAR